MASVTQRIKAVTQPRGGYINPKSLTEIQLTSSVDLYTEENIHASLIGLAVDYLSRFICGTRKEEAFKISFIGARIIGELENAQMFLDDISGLDDKSIKNACKLVGYDVIYRAGIMGYRPVDTIKPDKITIANIRELVNRAISFFKSNGPVVIDGFALDGAYTKLINIGDGDFITKDTLWDFKVSVATPTKDHTLQLLIYYLMGLKSNHKDAFLSINKLGIFNPRLNRVYLIDINSILQDVIDDVSREVIGY